MSSKIMINVRPNQTRVAYLENENLIDFQIEKTRSPTLVGSVFRGKVMRVLPGMQAAFVNIGLDRAAFLYAGDIRVDQETASQLEIDEEEGDPIAAPTDKVQNALEETVTAIQAETTRIPIQELIKEGQYVLCQVAKDPLGTKGARITTHISLPGRTLVYMPTVPHFGVSKKIEDEEEKNRLKNLIGKIKLKGGVIIRTAGEGATEDSLRADLEYLGRVWKEVQKSYEKRKTPGQIHKEPDLEIRALRDFLNQDVTEVMIDDRKVYRKVLNFVTQFLPRYKNIIKLYDGSHPLFDLYNIDLEITRSLDRKIWLKSGGYLVFDEAEALVVVDVNTGKYVGKKDIDETILQTNMEAVKEIAHQLRIRNCGGIIIIDLIDMAKEAHREQVLNLLIEELKLDRAKTTVTAISGLGLVEMTRKRIRPSLTSTLCEPCDYCEGTGYIKRPMTVASEIFRSLERQRESLDQSKMAIVRCHSDVADWVYEEESDSLDDVENRIAAPIVFKVEPKFHIEEYAIDIVDK